MTIKIPDPTITTLNAAQGLYYPWLLGKMQSEMFRRPVPQRNQGTDTFSRYKAVEGKRGRSKAKARRETAHRIAWQSIVGLGLAQ